nr:hypothetical protein [Mycolicibacterium chubuense]
MRALVMPVLLPVVAASSLIAGAGVAHAAPPGFPDVDAFSAVDPSGYQLMGAHPSMSGWVFSTPAGLRCQDSLIPDLGVFCQGPIAGSAPGTTMVSVSLTTEGAFSRSDLDPGAGSYPLLPTGAKLAAGNGVVCAVPTADTLACRAGKPDSWAADTPDPPDRHYGEHGFVVSPSGSWAY